MYVDKLQVDNARHSVMGLTLSALTNDSVPAGGIARATVEDKQARPSSLDSGFGLSPGGGLGGGLGGRASRRSNGRHKGGHRRYHWRGHIRMLRRRCHVCLCCFANGSDELLVRWAAVAWAVGV